MVRFWQSRWRGFARRWGWAAALVVVGVCGCNAPREDLAVFNRQLQSGQLGLASIKAESKISGRDTPRGADLLWTLQLGTVERMRQRYADSAALFDRAEEMLNATATDPAAMGRTVAAAAISDNITPYTGTIYDGIMANTYKALNFMMLGNHEYARVEFNRALDRQRRAREDFDRQIQARRQELDKTRHSQSARRSLEHQDVRSMLERAYPSLADFEPYPDFVNPFATYLAGVFLAATGDYVRASDVLRQSAGMLPNNASVLRDFAEVEQALDTGTRLPPTVWVFFENGLGPVKEEIRLDLPLFIVTDKVRYFGVALPQLVFRPAAAAYLDVIAGGQRTRTELVADMDRVIETEFQKDFDGIVLRAIISATAKAAGQYALEENEFPIAAMLMALFSYATTSADVRIWTALPKNFQAVRLPYPTDGQLTIADGRQPPFELQLPDSRHAIVYVKTHTPAATAIVDVIPF